MERKYQHVANHIGQYGNTPGGGFPPTSYWGFNNKEKVTRLWMNQLDIRSEFKY